MLFRNIVLTLSVCSTLIIHAQTEKKVDNQTILWSRYYIQLTLNKKWTLHSEFDNRLFLNPITENLFVFRIQGRYKWNPSIETGAGFTYFSVYTQDPQQDFDFEMYPPDQPHLA